jgi:RNA polymerase sigma-70 factor (ECF subfamily)
MNRDRGLEDEILRGVQREEPGAFDRFVSHFGNRIYAFGMRMCGHREDAEDVVQETLIAVHRSLSTLREPRAVTSWLYRTLANACLMRRRKSKFAPARELSLEDLLPHGDVMDAGPVLPEEAGPVAELYRKELGEALDRAVRDLPPDYRIVWLLRDAEGLSTEETAEALDIGISNVKMRLHRARLMLRKELAAFRPRDEGT